MYLFKNIYQLDQYLQAFRATNTRVGFVPTMGALHLGHLSLIEASNTQNELTVCSIFDNPTQFNEGSDLEKYPRTPGLDLALLAAAHCDVVFMPHVDEIYPPGVKLDSPIPPKALVQGMEGQFRPGHFEGVVQVVKRLLDIVQPSSLYMGQKDYQQAAIIGWMLDYTQLATELVVCPILREKNGLAMSSRNVRLDPAIRPKAVLLHETLLRVKEKIGTLSPRELQDWALEQLDKPHFRPEYFDIVDGLSLQPLNKIGENDFAVACTAVWAGEVRLIDNMILQKPE